MSKLLVDEHKNALINMLGEAIGHLRFESIKVVAEDIDTTTFIVTLSEMVQLGDMTEYCDEFNGEFQYQVECEMNTPLGIMPKFDNYTESEKEYLDSLSDVFTFTVSEE